MIQAARDYIEERTELQPLTAVVLGSGLGAFADELTDRVEFPYAEIPAGRHRLPWATRAS